MGVQFSVRNEGDDNTHGELVAEDVVVGLVPLLHGIHPASPLPGRVSFSSYPVGGLSGMVRSSTTEHDLDKHIEETKFKHEISTERF